MKYRLEVSLAVALCMVSLPSEGARNRNSARADQLAPMARPGGIPARTCVTQLLDGGLLMVGGEGTEGALGSAQVFGSDGTMTKAASLQNARSGHACVALGDGKVLVMGGAGDAGALNTAELYDPAGNQWTPAGNLADARIGLSATLLADGRVLVAGGGNGAIALDTLEVYEPASNTFRVLPGRLSSPRTEHAAARLPDGRVLIAGGSDGSRILDSMDVFDPASEVTGSGGVLSTPRAGLTATALPDGTVLLAGGTNGTQVLDSVDVYDAATGKIAEGAKMTSARMGQAAILGPEDNQVLLVGGDVTGSTAELYSLPAKVTDATSASSSAGTAARSSTTAQGATAMATGSDGAVRTAPGTGSASLEQCANRTFADCEWVNGNLNSSKATYAEGQSVPYRLVMTGVPITGTNTVTIEWDTTQQGKHALDYLTRYNATVQGANPCKGLSCSPGSSAPFAIPADSAMQPYMVAGRYPIYLQQIASGSHYFSMWGGTISAINAGYSYSPSPITYFGNTTTRITISFTTTTPNVVLAWGGHIASRIDWGASASAVAISGSPFHMRLVELNGSGGNQDRALSNDAVIFPANVTIEKDTVADTDKDFGFTADKNPDGTAGSLQFALCDNGATACTSGASNKKDFAISNFTTYTFTENLYPEYTQTVACQLQGTGSYDTTVPRTAKIVLQEGDTVNCKFTNTRKTVRLYVKKSLSPTGDTGLFDLYVGNSRVTDASGVGDGGSGYKDGVGVGDSITVTENEHAGTTLADYVSSVACDNNINFTSSTATSGTFKVPDVAGPINCTFTNTRKATAIIRKVMVGGTATFSFAGTISGQISASNGTISNVLAPGEYYSTEAAADGWPLTDIKCDDSNSTVDVANRKATFKLEAGETVTCTFTNTKRASLIIQKTTEGGFGSFTFTSDLPDAASFSIATTDAARTAEKPFNDLTPGKAYSVSESAAEGWDLTSRVCAITSTGSGGSTFPASGTTQPASITLGAGDTVTCTYTNTKRATAIVKKVMAGGTATFDFTGSLSGPISTNNGTLSKALAPGEYNATEATADGWTLTEIKCDDTNSTVDLANRKATFKLEAGETVTCTFTNVKKASLVIQKVTKGATGTFSFTSNLAAPATSGAFALTTTQAGTATALQFLNLTPGTFTVSETSATGWELLTRSCELTESGSGNSSSSPSGQQALEIKLEAGDKVTCTFTNQRKTVKVIVQKSLMPTGDSGTFDLMVGGAIVPGGEGVTNGGKGEKVVNVGDSVTVSEAAHAGTILTDYVSSLACDNDVTPAPNTGISGTFTIPDIAGPITCIFTNQRPSVSITKGCTANMSVTPLATTVTSSGKICNTGPVDLKITAISDVQTGGGTVSATVIKLGGGSLINTPLAVGACVDYQSTYTPVNASSGTDACSIQFADKATVTAITQAGGVTVTKDATATCKLCACTP